MTVHRLRALMANTGLDTHALARQLGVTNPTMARWLAGQMTPSAANLAKIAALEAQVAAGEIKPWPARVRAIRAALGVSQEELARRLGVRQATVNRWERQDGQGRVPQRQSAALLEALELTLGLKK